MGSYLIHVSYYSQAEPKDVTQGQAMENYHAQWSKLTRWVIRIGICDDKQMHCGGHSSTTRFGHLLAINRWT
jgi:hypothetical protein